MQVAHIRPPHTTVITSPHQHRPTDTEGPASLPEHSEDFSAAATTATGGDSEEVFLLATTGRYFTLRGIVDDFRTVALSDGG